MGCCLRLSTNWHEEVASACRNSIKSGGLAADARARLGDCDGCMGEAGDVPSHSRHGESSVAKEEFSFFKYTVPSTTGHVIELEDLVMKRKLRYQGRRHLRGHAAQSPTTLREFGAGVPHGGNKFQAQ